MYLNSLKITELSTALSEIITKNPKNFVEGETILNSTISPDDPRIVSFNKMKTQIREKKTRVYDLMGVIKLLINAMNLDVNEMEDLTTSSVELHRKELGNLTENGASNEKISCISYILDVKQSMLEFRRLKEKLEKEINEFIRKIQ